MLLRNSGRALRRDRGSLALSIHCALFMKIRRPSGLTPTVGILPFNSSHSRYYIARIICQNVSGAAAIVTLVLIYMMMYTKCADAEGSRREDAAEFAKGLAASRESLLFEITRRVAGPIASIRDFHVHEHPAAEFWARVAQPGYDFEMPRKFHQIKRDFAPREFI